MYKIGFPCKISVLRENEDVDDEHDDDDDDDDRRGEKGVTLHVEQIVEVVGECRSSRNSEQLKRNFSRPAAQLLLHRTTLQLQNFTTPQLNTGWFFTGTPKKG